MIVFAKIVLIQMFLFTEANVVFLFIIVIIIDFIDYSSRNTKENCQNYNYYYCAYYIQKKNIF
jgi:hypothetical protein